MNIEELTEYCQSLKFVTTEILWGDVLVFKVGGKMFCFAPMDEGELKMNLKCDPEEHRMDQVLFSELCQI